MSENVCTATDGLQKYIFLTVIKRFFFLNCDNTYTDRKCPLILKGKFMKYLPFK